jgi:hypothetical protein
MGALRSASRMTRDPATERRSDGAGVSWFLLMGRRNHDHDRVNQPGVRPAGGLFTLCEDHLAAVAFRPCFLPLADLLLQVEAQFRASVRYSQEVASLYR